MKILIACNHYAVASGRYMMDAFRRSGHEVRTAGDSQGALVWGMVVDPKYIWKPDSAIADVDPEWPDLVVVMDTDQNVWNQVEVWKGFNAATMTAPIVIYTVDNHVRDVESDLFVHYFLAHYHGPCYPVDPARKDHTWLPCATDDKLFTPSPIAWADREYDICMVGVMYPRRIEVINALKDEGFKVLAATGLLYDEYRAAYHNSRISLCVSAAGDVAQRIYETGGMGCVILTDPLLDFADEMTNKALRLFGRATYTNPKEAVNIARELLGHQPQAFQIDAVLPIENGALGEQAAREMQKNCKPHTWEARAQVIVNWFEREYGKVEAVTDIKPNEVYLPFLNGLPKEEHQRYINAAKVLVNGATDSVVGEVTTDLVSDGNYPDELTKDNPIGITAAEAAQAMADVSAELNKPVESKPERKPYLNLGCGTTHFPGERPPGHEFIDESVYAYPEWLNVDKVEGVGADKVFDLFAYPWPLESNSFDGAILGHIAEHIPHEIKLGKPENPQEVDRKYQLSQLQDGWYAFFSELYRVLTPGAMVHVISPYAWSNGAVTDPTHTRLLTEHTFTHGLSPEQYTGTFKYNIDCNFENVGHQLRYSPWAQPFGHDPDLLGVAIMTRVNMVYDFYVKLRAVK